MQQRIHVTHLASGQPRPYADHDYIAEIEIQQQYRYVPPQLVEPVWEAAKRDDKEIRNLARLLVHAFKDDPEWYEPRLKSITPVGPGKWRVHIVQPYLD